MVYYIIETEQRKIFRVEELNGDIPGTNIFPLVLQVIINLCPSPKIAVLLMIFQLTLELRGFHFFFPFSIIVLVNVPITNDVHASL